MQTNELEFTNIQLPGKIQLSHKCLYVGYIDKEYIFNEFEVLAMTVSPKSLFELTMLNLKQTYDDETIIKLHDPCRKLSKYIVNKILNIYPDNQITFYL